jgi:hypothetical protein
MGRPASRCFCGPTRKSLLDQIRRGGLSQTDRIFLGQGRPAVVLEHVQSRWQLRALLERPRAAGPQVPDSWGELAPGPLLVEESSLDGLATAIERMEWPWDPPPTWRVEVTDLGPDAERTIAALASTALFDNGQAWVARRVATLPCVLWETACQEQVERAERILGALGAKVRATKKA